MEDVLKLGDKGPADSTTVNGASPAISKKQKKKEAKKAKQQQKAQNQTQQALPQEDDDSDSNSEVEAQEARLQNGKKATAFEQRDLVARAFAGDNVIQVCDKHFKSSNLPSY